MSMPDAITCLMRPRSIAVIGASADPSRIAGRPVASLLKHGYTGAIYPVNPRNETIAGLRCYPDVASLPAVPDVAIVLLGPQRATAAVHELAAAGVPAAIVLAGGYGESGEEGRRRQAELSAAAGRMRLLGPNTIGLVNLTDAIPLSASGILVMDRFPMGSVGVVSQSGGILGSLLSRATARGIGLSKLVSTGNEVDLEVADLIGWLAHDPATCVIAVYIEGIRNPAALRDAALAAARAGKPVVAYKVGRSEAGAKAAVSHTGALAGSDRIVDALFDQVGIIRAATFADLLDIPATLAAGRTLAGRRVAILTSTGGAGTLVADGLGAAGFETPPPDAATAARLCAIIEGDQAAPDRNPIDVTLAGLQAELLGGAATALLESPTYDALTIVVGSSGVGRPDLWEGTAEACLAASSKPVVAYVSPHAPDVAARLIARGVPAFAAPESVASALSALRRAGQWRPPTAAPAPVQSAPAGLGTDTLDEAAAKRLFAHFGVPVVREHIVTDAASAAQAARDLGGPVALKMLSSEVTHKSDVGGVALGLAPDTIGARLEEMRTAVTRHTGRAPQQFLVQEMVRGGQELILGLKRDPLGPALMVGFGGVTAELMGDTALTLLPPDGTLTRESALTLLRTLKSWPLLDGYRGRPKADVAALTDAIIAFSAMAAVLGPRLIEAEINPLFVLGEGQGVRAADGVAVLSP
jgi:acyl-CoA synthetase (NDP forming)